MPPVPLTPSARGLEARLARRFDLSRAECDALARFLARSVRIVGDRVALIEQGAAPGEIHIVLEGWACRVRTLGDGRRQVVAFYLPGDVCDFDVFLMQAMDATLVAMGPLKVAGVSRAALNELSHGFPRVGQGLWWASLVNAAVQREWMANIAGRSGAQRIAHLACELFTRMALAGHAERDGIAFPATQAELGGACGMTPEHTNRTLRALRSDGLMAIERRRLTILDPARLVALAGFDAGYLHAGGPIAALPALTAGEGAAAPALSLV